MPHPPDRFSARHVASLARPDRNSFSGLVADAECEAARACRQETIVRGPYGIVFDTVLKDHEGLGRQGFALPSDVEAAYDATRGSDVSVMVYVIWFGMPPAMMTGYIDGVERASARSRKGPGRSAPCSRRSGVPRGTAICRGWQLMGRRLPPRSLAGE